MFQGIFKSAINDANKNYIFGTGSIPINIKTAQLATFADGTTKQQGYQVAEVNKLISTMLTGWDAAGNKPKSMSDNFLELILSCDNGFVVKKRLQFPHIIAWQNDSTPYNIADVYKEFSIDNWLKADDFENPDITLVVEPTDEILTTSTATPPEVTTEQSGRFYLYYRNLPVGINRVHIEFHIKTRTEPIDFDLEVIDGLSFKDAQTILASDEQAKINVLLSGVKDVYNFTGAEGNFEEITMHEWSELYQQIISLKPSNKFTHDLYFVIYVALSELDTLDEFVEEVSYDAIDYPQVAQIPGYHWNGVISGEESYFHIHLENLKEGDVITFFDINDGNYTYRFLDAYKGTTRVPSASSNVGAKVVTIPSGVDNVYLSYAKSYSEGNVRIDRETTSKSIKGLTLPSNVASRKGAASVKAEALQPNTILTLFDNFDNKKNSSLEVYAKFDSLDTITLVHGGDIAYGNKVVVDAEKITCYYNGTQNFQVSHGLAISSYIHIIVTRGKRNNARVTINTASGTFTTEEINLIACRSGIYAVSSSTLSDVVLSYVAKDLLKDIYLFGDSYTSLMDPSRYPKYLDEVYNCIDNMMMCGFGGVSSIVEIQSLISALSLAKPKYIIWALGMNDADSSSAVNENWLNCYNDVIEYCKRYEIVPIFCTIPNVPTINNSFKNDIVRNSGYRYIDFAKAVNAEDVGSHWYDGMLSSDGVHPTELGAKALAARFITDFPEIIEK